MLGLPQSTEFNKRIPKQKFYDNMTVSPTLKKLFVEQVRIVYWRNKIAASTMNLAPGTSVTELEVFEIRLNQPTVDESILRQMDKEIPYHILFLLEYEGKYKAVIGYKEVSATEGKTSKVNQYYSSEWVLPEAFTLKPSGLSVDEVYESFVRQIAGNRLHTGEGESIKESVENTEKRLKLKKQIENLQAKIRKEKQLNKQMEMNAELRKLKKELEAI